MNTEAKTLKNLIERRRSLYPKDYAPTPIAPEILADIMEVASLAPNHKKTKPWRFHLFQNEEKAQLAEEMATLYQTHTPPELFKEKKYQDIQFKIRHSGAVISISAAFSGSVPEWEDLAAVAMGVQNMYLMCTAYGLGCYWSSPMFAEHLSSFLSLEPSEKCLGLFYIGNLAE
ncbi:nitroreductase family protein [Riemerella columbina]|uniref:nitroreductase family protein n=1 Tax=Riemerella columbina TaxID=103810 RepID=UPI0026702FCC|nr:nitroreductase [Riemerella columbina]WKS94734.1 nitroreductase [Riemerella columbina]